MGPDPVEVLLNIQTEHRYMRSALKLIETLTENCKDSRSSAAHQLAKKALEKSNDLANRSNHSSSNDSPDPVRPVVCRRDNIVSDLVEDNFKPFGKVASKQL